MRQRIDVPPALARKLARLAAKEQKAQDALEAARAELGAALADAHDGDGTYSVGAIADAIGWSKTATHALIARER